MKECYRYLGCRDFLRHVHVVLVSSWVIFVFFNAFFIIFEQAYKGVNKGRLNQGECPQEE